MKRFLHWTRDNEGATSVEYAVMLALIISVCVGAIRIFGSTVGDSFATSASQMQNYFPSGS
jgi:pilus assembly protein Flp/PilA